MCGIAGIFGSFLKDKPKFKKSVRSLKYRGPNAEGFYFDNGCFLGHKRLSIIDPGGGAQPMQSNNGRFIIVFNGEIYNFNKLKSKLNNYKFKTKSDTEVILALYQKYGHKVVDYIEGAFAFAIFDKLKSTIFLARDPIGMKPLYYYFDNKKLVFASEIKTILQILNTNQKINEQAIYDYFCLKHIPAPNTIYKNIFKLESGTWVLFKKNRSGINFKKQKYWQAILTSNNNYSIESLRQLILKTVEEHLVSDIDIGAFLSGGIDSSTIVWAMKELGINPKTYTVGFGNPQTDDDLIYSRLVAKFFNTDHHELTISKNNFQTEAQKAINYFDQPFADSAVIPCYFIAKETGKHIRVILSGDGGDELFYGYQAYMKMYRQEKLSSIIPFFTKMRPSSNLEMYFGFDQDQINLLLSIKHPNVNLKLNNNIKDVRLKMRMLDLHSTLPEYYLNKVDMTSMISSVEIRNPFLHRPFIEYVLKIPIKDHYKNGVGKHILYQAMKDRLPKQILKRPKQGFYRKIDMLLTSKNLNLINKTLSKTGFFNNCYLNQTLLSYKNNRANQNLVWKLLVFTWWLNHNEKYIHL
jgi:asparagine synthase (glutamine-hydrolysing)